MRQWLSFQEQSRRGNAPSHPDCRATIERAGHDLPRLFRVQRADFPELGDVQILQRARPCRHRNPDRRAVAEGQRIGAILNRRQSRPQLLVKMVIRKPDLIAEDHLRVVHPVRDDRSPRVRREQACVEIDQAAKRREPELPRLQDDVLIVDFGEELLLRRVRLKLYRVPLLIHDPVQIGNAPMWITQTIWIGGHTPSFLARQCAAKVPSEGPTFLTWSCSRFPVCRAISLAADCAARARPPACSGG